MAGTDVLSSEELEKDLLETVLNLAKENQDAKVVKDILSYNREDIKLKKLPHGCSDAIQVFQVTFGDQKFIVKKLNRGKENDAKTKESLSVEAKGLLQRQKLSPRFTPLMYCWSEKLNCLALEDLSSLKSLRMLLTSGEIDKQTTHRIAVAVAQMHSATLSDAQSERFKELVQEFQASPSIDSLSDLLRVNLDTLEAGRRRDCVARLLASDQIKSTLASVVETTKTKKQALLNGQVIGESVLINDEEVKLTSGQYLFVGPCSLDLGQLLAQYLSAYHEHMLTEENNDWHRKISYLLMDMAKETVGSYLEAVGEFFKEEEGAFVSEVAVHCGIELVNRALKSIDCPTKSLEILVSGERLLNAYHRIHDVGQLVFIALALC